MSSAVAATAVVGETTAAAAAVAAASWYLYSHRETTRFQLCSASTAPGFALVLTSEIYIAAALAADPAPATLASDGAVLLGDFQSEIALRCGALLLGRGFCGPSNSWASLAWRLLAAVPPYWPGRQ